jgi:methyltransferase-like protein
MERKSQWKQKLNNILDTCQGELKRTTQIGKKMLAAGKENAQLNDIYESLGKHIYESIEAGKLNIEDQKVSEMCSSIEGLKSHLEQLENEVKDIKKS